MPAKTNVNYMTVVHKKSTGIAACFPDVCKTPTPGGPVPIPYPNIAMSSQAAKTTKKVKIDKEGVMVKGSNFSMSSGDEAGNAGGGVISSKFKGKAEFLNYSFDVKFEGKAVARLADPLGNNCGSTFNGPCPAEGQPPVALTPAQEAEQKEACERVRNECGVNPEDRAKVAAECGMDPDHAEAIRNVCADTNRSVTVRSTNPACLDKIKAGFPAKPGNIKSNTVSADRLKKSSAAVQKKVRDNNLEGFVGDIDESGKLKGLVTADGVVPLSDIPPVPDNTFTGDYDLHDMFGEGGERIINNPLDSQMPGHDLASPERDFQRDLNRATDRGNGRDMIQHGPQSNYGDWAAANEIAEPNPKLQLPDVSPDDPLLAFDENGHMYKIENEDQLRDYYQCKGQEVPDDWDDQHVKERRRRQKNAK